MLHMLASPCLIFYHLLLRDDPLVATLEVGQLVRGVEKHASGKDSNQLFPEEETIEDMYS